MLFKEIKISNWRQFQNIEIGFHEHLTVITGANGAGKTTILNLLSRHFGWHGQLVSTPHRSKSGTVFISGYWNEEYLKDYLEWLESNDQSTDQFERKSSPPVPLLPPNQQFGIGELTYWNGAKSSLSVPSDQQPVYQVNIANQKEVKGLHIPSHRPIYSYQTVENIPTVPRKRDEAFRTYSEMVRSRFYGGHHQRTPNYFMKETLIALATFGYGNQVIEADLDSQNVFEGFQEILRKVLPKGLGFQRIAVRLPDIVLVTRSGDFSLDSVSGGVAAVIDLAWQIFMYAPTGTQFAVTIDEPENHLHPELQRSVLRSFVDAFPDVQFLVTTHSPFIVTSVPESAIFALRYNSSNRVYSEKLSSLETSGTSNEILRDVLGLSSSSPMWVEEKLTAIQSEFKDDEVTPGMLEKLRIQLKSAGLEKFVPDILAKLVEDHQQ